MIVRGVAGVTDSQVVVELVLLLHYRVDSRPLAAGQHPDDVARRMSGLTACTPGGLLHSTSWRIVDNTVVLTYAGLPDPAPDVGAIAVALDAMVGGAGPLLPGPTEVGIGAVAAHACRHLALLAATDQQVALAARAIPSLWEPIYKLTPGCAGGLDPVALAV
jgi:hypothetical protein